MMHKVRMRKRRGKLLAEAATDAMVIVIILGLGGDEENEVPNRRPEGCRRKADQKHMGVTRQRPIEIGRASCRERV
jgi:hypothetical protein